MWHHIWMLPRSEWDTQMGCMKSYKKSTLGAADWDQWNWADYYSERGIAGLWENQVKEE